MTWEIETVKSLSDTDLFVEINLVGWDSFLWDPVDAADAGYAQYLDNINGYNVPVDSVSFLDIQFDQTVDPIPSWDEVKERFYRYVDKTHKEEYKAMFAANGVDRTMRALAGEAADYGSRGETWAEYTILTGEPKPTWQEMKAQWAILQASDSAKEIVEAAHKTMSDNINAQILVVFSTSDKVSASAFAQSWKMKKNNPLEYITQGLVAREAIAGFAINDPLDTEAKILAYYTEKVNQLIAFDKFRDAEIMTYLAVKTAQGL